MHKSSSFAISLPTRVIFWFLFCFVFKSNSHRNGCEVGSSFWFAFPYGQVTFNIFSCICWSSVSLLWRNVSSSPCPLLWWGCWGGAGPVVVVTVVKMGIHASLHTLSISPTSEMRLGILSPTRGAGSFPLPILCLEGPSSCWSPTSTVFPWVVVLLSAMSVPLSERISFLLPTWN